MLVGSGSSEAGEASFAHSPIDTSDPLIYDSAKLRSHLLLGNALLAGGIARVDCNASAACCDRTNLHRKNRTGCREEQGRVLEGNQNGRTQMILTPEHHRVEEEGLEEGNLISHDALLKSDFLEKHSDQEMDERGTLGPQHDPFPVLQAQLQRPLHRWGLRSFPSSIRPFDRSYPTCQPTPACLPCPKEPRFQRLPCFFLLSNLLESCCIGASLVSESLHCVIFNAL